MNINPWIALFVTFLVIGEVVAGQALFVRRTTPFRDGLDSYHPEFFVYREENPVAFWVIISFQSILLASDFWHFW